MYKSKVWLVLVLTACTYAGVTQAAHVTWTLDNVITSSSQAYKFVINGINYDSTLICEDMRVGDKVQFITGSNQGHCAFATVRNQRTGKTCNLICR